MKISGRSISKGVAEAPLLSTDVPLSFLGQVDPKTGVIIDAAHPLHGQSIAEKVLAFPYGKGSTVGSYVIYALHRNGAAPAAFIVKQCETIVAVGAIISGIPAVDNLSGPLPDDGSSITVNGTEGTVTYS
ncbi:MAG TPA: DUF126 domain-containing protein [Methanocorpusculum sp.]|nr:DUF126 domain-containing protein [Methanocorpusculum sp.]